MPDVWPWVMLCFAPAVLVLVRYLVEVGREVERPAAKALWWRRTEQALTFGVGAWLAVWALVLIAWLI